MKTSNLVFKQKESNITFLSTRFMYIITWFFFLSICTLNRLLPYSDEVACGIFSAIHSFSSSTSRRNWIREKINILVVHRTFHTAHWCSWLFNIYNKKKVQHQIFLNFRFSFSDPMPISVTPSPFKLFLRSVVQIHPQRNFRQRFQHI